MRVRNPWLFSINSTHYVFISCRPRSYRKKSCFASLIEKRFSNKIRIFLLLKIFFHERPIFGLLLLVEASEFQGCLQYFLGRIPRLWSGLVLRRGFGWRFSPDRYGMPSIELITEREIRIILKRRNRKISIKINSILKFSRIHSSVSLLINKLPSTDLFLCQP